MRKIFIESVFTMIGLLITIPFLISPTPVLMFLFTFIAQPCFLVAIVLASIQIVKDLRKKQVI
ncbi:hypothetical protein WJR50_27690 [Catalinimonas sp. 4WD22]|uniref:hypothetical protein n=1 Tax=Catalinimonas locisalis TaxID=3133978 RepID=UPI003101393E